MTAAIAFAETPSGRSQILDDLLPLAELIGDTDRVDALHSALLRAERNQSQQEISKEPSRNPARSVSIKELQEVANDFGVALEQARRDHAISHILGAPRSPASKRRSPSTVGQHCPGRCFPDFVSVKTSTSLLEPTAGRRPTRSSAA